MKKPCCFIFVATILTLGPAMANAAPEVKVIADMEDKTAFSANGRKTQPAVAITDGTASQGKKSLRFAHHGNGPARAGIRFPIKGGGEGFDVLAFDIYCERETHFSRLNVRLSQKPDAPKKIGEFSTTVHLNRYVDGFATVRLAVGAGFEFLSVGGAKPDWGKLQEVSFYLHDEGDTVFYLDNIRLERMGLKGSSNLLFNGSFELTATPDVPDGWGRDLAIPPFGVDVWGIDTTEAYEGKKCLRIEGVKKFARYWIGHLKSTRDQPYTFSLFMKSAMPDTRAEIRINGVKGTRREVVVGGEWERFSVTGVASGAGMFPQVTLLSGGPLWIDAAQLQSGTKATTFQGAVLDLVKQKDVPADDAQPNSETTLAVVTSDHESPSGKADSDASPLVTLDGTEFDFYTREASARARCYLNASEADCGRMSLSWKVENHEGVVMPTRSISPRPGFNEWTIPLEGLPEGTYSLKVNCKPADGPSLTSQRIFRKLKPAKHEVRINQWGRFLVCDGQPHLWFGFYDALYSKAKIPSAWAATLDDMKNANCNTVLMYTHRLIAQPDVINKALDEAHERGIKVWLHLSWIFSYINPRYAKYDRYKNEAEAIAALEKIINAHKDHPALLGWCHLDEPANRPTIFTSILVKRWYRRIKNLDPHHPCISSHLTHLGESKLYGGSVDFAMIPFHSPRDVRAYNLFKEFQNAGFGISTNAAFYGAIHRPNESTPAQARVSIYAPIILGARGFCSYTYRPASTQTWREIGRVGEELATLTPVLCTADRRLRVDVTSGSKDVYALLKRHGKKYIFLAVNTAPKEVEAVFKLTDAESVSLVKPLFDNVAPKVDRVEKRLSVTMTPQSSVAWEITP